MGDICNIGHFLRKRISEPKVVVEGYRLTQYGQPCKTKIFHNVDLAIEAAKYRAAESAGAAALIFQHHLLPPDMDIDAHTGAVGVERVESCGDSRHYVGIALVTYTLGTYLPQVQMLPEVHMNAALSRAPSA